MEKIVKQEISDKKISDRKISDEKTIREKYRKLTKMLIERNITITTMESITAGQIASLLTDTEGASAVLKGAYVTYSNEAKIMQGVPEKVIDRYGVYSKETARAMALACKKAYGADIGIGITGSTGNVDPANHDSVPGEVYYAIAFRDAVADGFFMMGNQPTRLAYKLYAADKVADRLLEMI